MLNRQEEKLIKKYCTFPTLSKVYLAMSLLIGGLWIVLVMINDLVFNGEFYMLGLGTYLGIVCVYLVLFGVCFLAPRIGMKKERWQKILQKAGAQMSETDYSAQMAAVLGARGAGHLLKNAESAGARRAGEALDAAAAVGSLVTVTQMTNETEKNARRIAEIFKVEVPKVKKQVAAIILLPVFLLTAVYVPAFFEAKQNTDAGIALAAKSVYALQTALQQDCDHVSIDDPKNRYKDRGYQVTGYLYGYEEPYNAYLSAVVGNDGVIREVRYSVGIDIQAGKEENLEKAKLDLLKLNVMLNDSGVDALSQEMMEEYTLPEEFAEQFRETSYYEGLRFEQSENMTVYYMTDTQEEYDEYSESYIYISIDA